MPGVHPVRVLRERLVADFSHDLPAGVHPVDRFCGEPQFFPGASGLLTDATWTSVKAGASAPTSFPCANVRVIVVGNYHASRASYERIVDRDIGGLRGTWGKLKKLLGGVPPTEVPHQRVHRLSGPGVRHSAVPDHAAILAALRGVPGSPVDLISTGLHRLLGPPLRPDAGLDRDGSGTFFAVAQLRVP